MNTDAPIRPAQAENDAWWAYRGAAMKQGREVDERTFRDAWRQGSRFTFVATSQLSPALAAFIDWMDYTTSWSQPRRAEPEPFTVLEHEPCGYCGSRFACDESVDHEMGTGKGAPGF